VGFAFVLKKFRFATIIFMAVNKRKERAGTEAVHQIAGMAKANGAFYANLENEELNSELKVFN
jgi:cysteine desulfurase